MGYFSGVVRLPGTVTPPGMKLFTCPAGRPRRASSPQSPLPPFPALCGKLRPLPCGSSPPVTRSAGLTWGPPGAARHGVFTYPAGRPRRASSPQSPLPPFPALCGKLRPLPCGSSPHVTRSAGLTWGPPGAARHGVFTYPAGRPRRASSPQSPLPPFPALCGKLRPLPCGSSPPVTRSAGLTWGPPGAARHGVFTYPAGRPRRAAPCPP